MPHCWKSLVAGFSTDVLTTWLFGLVTGDLRDEDEQTKRQILKANAILLVIKQSFEAEDLLRTITKLYNLLQKATGE